MNEFEIIETYFKQRTATGIGIKTQNHQKNTVQQDSQPTYGQKHSQDHSQEHHQEHSQKFDQKHNQKQGILLGIGDDAAITRVPAEYDLATCIDTLVADRHFPADAPAYAIGYKALAVNLSDLAAMGATPKWFTLALTLPESKPAWLKAFAEGLFTLAEQANITLIGGDTTRGPLSITVQANGLLPKGSALTRHGASADDNIYVSGIIGNGYLGLAEYQQQHAQSHGMPNDIKEASDGNKTSPQQTKALKHYLQPQPQNTLGMALLEKATSAIDVSDGLLADLNHILTVNKLHAEIDISAIPFALPSANLDQQLTLLSGGDDYELCFTAPASLHEEIMQIGEKLDISVSLIGKTVNINPRATSPITHMGEPITVSGYNHF